MVIKIGINGFGRIGRIFYRSSLKDDSFNKKFEIKAINDITDAKTLAHLLKYDSNYGILDKTITHSDSKIKVNDEELVVFSERDPIDIPWNSLDIDIVLESTGIFRDKESASKHIKAGASKVVISAPAKNPDVTIVLGVNQEQYMAEKHDIISMASCTTNCFGIMVKVLHDNFEIKRGLMTTCHAYTNDQRLLDLPHKDLRRARAGASSIIPTTTGAAKAIGLIIPELEGKLNGIALRVPVPVGSITDFTVELKNDADETMINKAFEKASENKMRGILQYSKDPIVSSDIVGNSHSCILDSASTMVLKNKTVWAKLLGWYDNEWGFSNRLVDLFKYIEKN